jgi:hypothetical protein
MSGRSGLSAGSRSRRGQGGVTGAVLVAFLLAGCESAPTSRAAAEVAVFVALVDKANGCSEECGGTVLRRLPTVRWDSDPSGKSKASGTIGGTVGFKATYDQSQGWMVELQAC